MPDRSGRPESSAAGPVEPINGFQILDQVADLPISTWRYHWEGPQVRHLGPMAQDWAATFGLGEDDTRIAMVDANGVALVSIQALYRLVGDLRQEVADLRGRVETLSAPDEAPGTADNTAEGVHPGRVGPRGQRHERRGA
jgi:hypothetical protein